MDGHGQARTGTDRARRLSENLTEQHELFIRMRGEKWREELARPKNLLRLVMARRGCSVIAALERMMRAATESGDICAGLVMTLSAACVEIIKEDGV